MGSAGGARDRAPGGGWEKRGARARIARRRARARGRGRDAPSIFPSTRSTAPEHPEHIIATLSTIVALIPSGRGGERAGAAARGRVETSSQVLPARIRARADRNLL